MTAIQTCAVALSVGVFALCVCSVIAQEGDAVITSDVEDADDYIPVEEKGTELESGITLIRENSEIENLRSQIEEREKQVLKTEEEIQSINRELNEIYKKKDSLGDEINGLTLTNRRNEAQIRVTEENIHRGQLNLKSLSNSIDDNTENLDLLNTVLIKNYQEVNEFELSGTKVIFFFHESLFDILNRVEELERYSKALHEQLGLLKNETEQLEENKQQVIDERLKLRDKQKELEDRRKIYQFSITRKENLIAQTKNDETEFQSLLREKQEERMSFQQEIYEYESRIEYLRDPTAVPEPGKGVLRLPFGEAVRITQRFGETTFAQANAVRYGRPFHDGIDLGLPSGTQLLASADGVVIGTGNTDLVSSCQSWGKWVLIKHPFGLTTIYAHLSLTKVRLGQQVKAGELIGYSGNTGFSTGPHLHFGVYDSNGIRVVPYEQVSRSARCRGLLVPVAAQDAKLDPLDYLPL